MKKIDRIIKDYNKYSFIWLHDKTNQYADNDRFSCFFRYGIILIPYNDTDWTPSMYFALLHEIGHCETYKNRQSSATREFLATQWAINNSKKYNIMVSQKEKNEWQEYIYSFLKIKNKSKYKLNWNPMKECEQCYWEF